VYDGVSFHSLGEFETLFFHAADRWRVFMGNEKDFHVAIMK